MSLKEQLSYFLWVEKYRPTCVSNILLPSTTRQYFAELVARKEIPNLLLYSTSPGVGKTTTALTLCSDIDADTLYINTSSERGIDTLRSRIGKFASTMSMSGAKTKVAILDEFDGASLELQNGLRAAIEEYHKACRFILVCNTLSRIIPQLQSRCQLVDFNFTAVDVSNELKPRIVSRLKQILQFEKIEFDASTIDQLVSTLYPDVRRMLNLLHQYSIAKGSIDAGIFSFSGVDGEFYQLLLQRKFNKARAFVIDHNYSPHDMYTALYKNFVPLLPKEKLPQAILTIAEYQRYTLTVPDPEINLAACLLELIALVPAKTLEG